MNPPVDSCGNCLTPERSVPVRPYLTQPDGDHGMRAYYRCPECGHRWWTAWLVGTEGLAARNESAA